jgi:hypothetical protein
MPRLISEETWEDVPQPTMVSEDHPLVQVFIQQFGCNMQSARQMVTSHLDMEALKDYVLPTVERGNCYKNAMEFISLNRGRGWTVVHGIPLGTGGDANGKRYGHAWLEKAAGGAWYALDLSAGQMMPADWYRHGGQVEYAVRHSESEACMMVVKTKLYGPWDKKVQQAHHSMASV